MTNMYYICQYIGAEYSLNRGVGLDLEVGVRKLLNEPKSGQAFNKSKMKKILWLLSMH